VQGMDSIVLCMPKGAGYGFNNVVHVRVQGIVSMFRGYF
jgi:hypothetical protein